MQSRYCGRVVKAMDLKSIGFSRAGSNPANIVFYFLFTLNNHHILSPLLHSCLLENLIDHQQNPLALRLTSKNKGSQGFLDLRLVMVVGYNVIGFESLQSLLNFFFFFLDILVFQQTFVKFTLLSCVIEAIL